MTVTAGVVGGALAIGFIWPNTAPPENTKPTGGPIKIAAPPKKVPLKVRERAAALAVASRFIDTAVARKNVDRAWGLVTPTLRAGYTRKQWDTANLPGIPPFPVAEARWRLQFSDEKGIGFTMALFPTKASHQQAQVFMIGLHKVGAGNHRHWLVDNWQAAPTTASQVASGGWRARPGHSAGDLDLGQGEREPDLAPHPRWPAQPGPAHSRRDRGYELVPRPARTRALRRVVPLS